MTNDSENFIQEVDEGLRQDRLLTLLKKYGPWAGGALAAVVIGVALYIWYQYDQTQRERRTSDAFITALNQLQGADPAAGKTAIDLLAEKGPGNYRGFAKMERAGLLQQEGDLAGAIAEFDAAAASASDPLVRDTARIRAAYIAADTQDFTALKARLQPIIDGGTPIAYLARELLGVQAWANGDTQLARQTLENLTLAFEAPESVRQRAQAVLNLLGPAPEAAAPASAAPAPAAGDAK